MPEIVEQIEEPEDVQISEDEQQDKQDSDEDYEFKLVGVVCHMGSADAGHYLSYINTQRSGDNKKTREEWLAPDNQKWLEFNDTTVQSF